MCFLNCSCPAHNCCGNSGFECWHITLLSFRLHEEILCGEQFRNLCINVADYFVYHVPLFSIFLFSIVNQILYFSKP